MRRALCLALAIVAGVTGLGLLVSDQVNALPCTKVCRNFTYVCNGTSELDDCIIYSPQQGHLNYYAAVNNGPYLHTLPGQQCTVYEGWGETLCPAITPGFTQECTYCTPVTQLPNVARYLCYPTPPTSS